MTERIDHATEAKELLEAGRDFDIRKAQVHATLALAEQQRLANLIALASHSHARWGNYAGEAGGMGVLFSYGETELANMRIRDDIREALGLS